MALSVSSVGSRCAERKTHCAHPARNTVSCDARRLRYPTRLLSVSSSSAAVQVKRVGEEAGADGLSLSRRTLLGGLAAGAVVLTLPQKSAALADGIRTVYVAGATGNTGRRVVQQLRAKGYKVRAGIRDRRKAESLGFALDSGIQLVQGDVTKGVDPLIEAIGDADAVISTLGFTGFNPSAATQVDEVGTINLEDAARARGVKHFVLQSSLLTNAVAVGQKDNPNYKFLNLFGGVLDHKLKAEQHLRASGLTWTIVRPGGLSNKPPSEVGNLITSTEDTLFGLDTEAGREISRDTVAEVLIAALEQPAADNKVVEIVASPTAAVAPSDKWFL